VFHALPGARAVGGCVRDALAGLPVQDLDMAAPFPPEEISERLKRAGFRIFETGLAHGTVTAVLHGTPIEVTSLRRDVSTDGRHAEVAWTTDWHEDAARRDFTINSMSMDADGALHDDHGGAADLHAGRVRFVGDPSTRLAEDYLRALRFFRFQARFGRGEPDPAAIAAIRAAVPGLARLSAERVWVRAEAPAGRAGPARVARPDGRCRRAAGGPPGSGRARHASARCWTAGTRCSAWGPCCPPAPTSARWRSACACPATRPRACVPSTPPTASPPPSTPTACAVSPPAPRRAARMPPPARSRAVAAAESPDRDLAPLFDLPPGPAFPLLGPRCPRPGHSSGPAPGPLLDATREWWIEHGGNRDACLAHLRELAESGPR
jgi:poly(A) polymerase/tRNA nucleotidyltransferase (CCA-adding enzyme)